MVDDSRRRGAVQRLASIAAAFGLAAVACAPSTSNPTASTPTRGGDLVIVRAVDTNTFDKTQMGTNPSIWIAKNIYQTLFTESPDGKTAVPSLATGYKLSDDKKTYTISLRNDVLFQNGQPMTSADVKFSINVNSASDSAWNFVNSAIQSIDTPDPYTVIITTKVTSAPLLADLSLFANAIIPNNYAGESKDAFYQKPIGTGPFGFEGGGTWEKGVSLKLVRNAHYWEKGKPYLNSVTWTVVRDDNARVLQLRGGQATVAESPAYSNIADLKKAAGVNVAIFPAAGEEQLGFNVHKAPFSDVHVRRAIAYALDKNAIARAVTFGYSEPANSFLAPTMFGYDSQAQPPNNDIAKAKQELALSSFPNGFKIVAHPSSSTFSQTILQIVQQQLKPLNIDVQLVPIDETQGFAQVQAGKYDVTLADITTDIVDPDELATFIVCQCGGADAWFSGYHNPQVDQWVQSARETFDPAQRTDLYSKIQEQVGQDVPFVFLYWDKYVYGLSNKVHGFQVYPTGYYHLENVWLEQ